MAENDKFSGIIVGIVMLFVAALLAGILLPIGIDALTNYTSTDANIQTMVAEALPIILIVAIVMLILGVIINAIKKSD